MDRAGAAGVADDVLIAILLRGGVKGRSVVELARELRAKYRTLGDLAAVSVEELRTVFGIGRVKAQVLVAALELGGRRHSEPVREGVRIRSPEDAVRVLRDQARALDREVFWVLLVNTKSVVVGHPVEVSKGLLDASLVHPREVFREAVRTQTSSVVLVHNHPSGDPTPSAEDVRITRQLVDAGRIMDIRVLDHVVLGRPSVDGGREFVSLREEGLVSFGS
jgi:DNA repair protein RadC